MENVQVACCSSKDGNSKFGAAPVCLIDGQEYLGAVDDSTVTCTVPASLLRDAENRAPSYKVLDQDGTEIYRGEVKALGDNAEPDKTVLSQMSLLDRLLPLLVIAAMLVGVLLGYYVPVVGRKLQTTQVAGVSVPIAIGLWLMMLPVLTKVRYELIYAIVSTRHAGKAFLTSFVLNWIIGPALMTGLAWAFLPDLQEYREGCIMVGLARCIAMVLIWNQLARGDGEICAVLVAFNSVMQIIFYAPLSLLYLNVISGGNSQTVDFWTVARSVLVFLGVPLVAGFALRISIMATAGRNWFETRFMPYFGPLALLALLYTIIVMFASQGQEIVNDIGDVARVAVPMLFYFFIMFTMTAGICWYSDVNYSYAVTQAFTAASNNFELAIAVAVGTFGVTSKQALAATVGPLIEVPVLLALVYLALWAEKRFWNAKDKQLLNSGNYPAHIGEERIGACWRGLDADNRREANGSTPGPDSEMA